MKKNGAGITFDKSQKLPKQMSPVGPVVTRFPVVLKDWQGRAVSENVKLA